MARSSLRSFLDQLVSLGHPDRGERSLSTLALTQSGVAVMKGEQEVQLFLPRERQTRHARAGAAVEELEEQGAEVDHKLFDVLRDFQRRLASERAVPRSC
ncbi:MAG: hypothetical protein R3E96_06290 [Planctomycetota bacterium]